METKEKKSVQKKLSYEELEAYANQTTAQARQMFEENNHLKQVIQDLKSQINYTEIGLVFKALDHKDLFSKKFIDKIVEKLEEILLPVEELSEDASNNNKE